MTDLETLREFIKYQNGYTVTKYDEFWLQDEGHIFHRHLPDPDNIDIVDDEDVGFWLEEVKLANGFSFEKFRKEKENASTMSV